MTWDESAHPRVPAGKVNGGQFTDKEMSTAVDAAREGAQLPGVQDYVVAEAGKIADLEHERLIIMNESGTILRRIDGGENRVETDLWQDADAKVGGVVLHNHPGGSKYARFSKGDLHYMLKVEAKHFSVVAGDYVLTLEPDYEHIYKVAGRHISHTFVENVVQDNIADRVRKVFHDKYFALKYADDRDTSDDDAFYTALDMLDRAQGHWTSESHLVLEDFVRNAVVEGYRDSGLRPTIIKWR